MNRPTPERVRALLNGATYAGEYPEPWRDDGDEVVTADDATTPRGYRACLTVCEGTPRLRAFIAFAPDIARAYLEAAPIETAAREWAAARKAVLANGDVATAAAYQAAVDALLAAVEASS